MLATTKPAFREVNKDYLAPTTRTQKLFPVGPGAGALVARPAQKLEKVNKAPTVFYSAPAVSSAPYLADDVKVKTNESILALEMSIAKEKDRRVAQIIYNDADNTIIGDNQSNNLTQIKKYSEPSSEDLLRKYLNQQIAKREEEKEERETQRIAGVDASIEQLRQEGENRRVRAIQEGQDVRLQQNLRAQRAYLEELIRNRDFGPEGFSGRTERQIRDSLRRVQAQIVPERRAPEERPIQVVGLGPKFKDERAADFIAKLNSQGINPEDYIRSYAERTYPRMTARLLRLPDSTLESKIISFGLGPYLSANASRQEKARLIATYTLGQDPRIREISKQVGIPIAFGEGPLPARAASAVDQIMQERAGALDRGERRGVKQPTRGRPPVLNVIGAIPNAPRFVF